jgi:hypothetical protein
MRCLKNDPDQQYFFPIIDGGIIALKCQSYNTIVQYQPGQNGWSAILTIALLVVVWLFWKNGLSSYNCASNWTFSSEWILAFAVV